MNIFLDNTSRQDNLDNNFRNEQHVLITLLDTINELLITLLDTINEVLITLLDTINDVE